MQIINSRKKIYNRKQATNLIKNNLLIMNIMIFIFYLKLVTKVFLFNWLLSMKNILFVANFKHNKVCRCIGIHLLLFCLINYISFLIIYKMLELWNFFSFFI